MAEVVESPAVGEAGGYLSAEDKRRFTLLAGILGGACFVAQMVLPFVVMIVVMGGMMAFDGTWMRHVDAKGAALHDGRIWLIERSASDDPRVKPTLKSFELGNEVEPTTISGALNPLLDGLHD